MSYGSLMVILELSLELSSSLPGVGVLEDSRSREACKHRYEPRHEKTNILHIRKQRRRLASR